MSAKTNAVARTPIVITVRGEVDKYRDSRGQWVQAISYWIAPVAIQVYEVALAAFKAGEEFDAECIEFLFESEPASPEVEVLPELGHPLYHGGLVSRLDLEYARFPGWHLVAMDAIDVARRRTEP